MRVDIKTYDALIALAEGYPMISCHDRYIVVENPAYKPDDGSEPCLVVDTFDLEFLA